MLRIVLLRISLFLYLGISFSASGQSNPEDWWVAIGDPNGGNSYLDMRFQNEVTGEIIHAFCIQADRSGPGKGDRFYLHSNGIWLMPERTSEQIMCIFKSTCNYSKPVISGKPDNCPPWGTSFTLTASCAQGEVKWYKKGGLDLELEGTGNSHYFSDQSGRYYVRCENSNGSCYSEFETLHFWGRESNAVPQPKLPGTICTGTEVNLLSLESCNARMGYFDRWYTNSNLSTRLLNTTVSPSVTTTYYVQCVNSTGCPANDSRSVTLTVGNPPSITVNNAEICAGSAATLSVSGCSGGTVTWSGGLTGNPATTGVLTSGRSYTATCTTSTGCISTAVSTVTVNALPVLTAQPAVCNSQGTHYSVSVTSSAGAVITSSAGTVSGNTVSDIPSGTTVTIRATLNGCFTEVTASQNCVVPCNAPNPTVSGDIEICVGETTTLTASGCIEGYTYLWSNNATTSTITVSNSGTYTVECVSDLNTDCKSSVRGSATVTVNALPVLTAQPAVCNSQGTHYSVSVTSSAGAVITSSAGTVNGNTVSDIPSGTTVTIRATLNGCFTEVTASQNCVVPCNAPNPTVSGDIEICAGETTTLTASGCTEGYSYLWSNNATTSTITVSNSGTYTVECVSTLNTDCKSSVRGSATVTVNALPVLTAQPAVCNSQGTHYSVSVTSSAGAVITSSAGTVSGNTVSDIPSGTTVTIRATLNGCFTEVTASQDCVVPCNAPNPTVSGDIEICAGETTTLTASGCIEGYSYLWSNNATTSTIAVSNSGTYTVECVSDLNTDCKSSVRGSATVTVNALPVLTAQPAVCNSQGTHYSVSVTSSAGAVITSSAGTVSGNTVSDIPSGTTVTIRATLNGCFTEVTASQNCTVLFFDLALRKTLTGGGKNPQVSVGDVVSFDITVFNQGNIEGKNIEVVDYLPVGLTLNDNNWTVGTDTLGVSRVYYNTPIASLLPGDSVKLTIHTTVSASATGVLVNAAEISKAENDEGLEDIDSTPDDNPGNDGTPKDDVVNEDGTNGGDEDDHDIEQVTVTGPDKVFDLALKKVLSGGVKNPVVKRGSTVTFKLRVFNQGNVEGKNIHLVDYIPSGLTLNDPAWTAGTDTLGVGRAYLNTPIASLAAGDSVEVAITFTVSSTAEGIIINAAEISKAENDEGLEDIDSTPDDNPSNDGTPKDDVINEDGKKGGDEDDHDIETITICRDSRCLSFTISRK